MAAARFMASAPARRWRWSNRRRPDRPARRRSAATSAGRPRARRAESTCRLVASARLADPVDEQRPGVVEVAQLCEPAHEQRLAQRGGPAVEAGPHVRLGLAVVDRDVQHVVLQPRHLRRCRRRPASRSPTADRRSARPGRGWRSRRRPPRSASRTRVVPSCVAVPWLTRTDTRIGKPPVQSTGCPSKPSAQRRGQHVGRERVGEGRGRVRAQIEGRQGRRHAGRRQQGAGVVVRDRTDVAVVGLAEHGAPGPAPSPARRSQSRGCRRAA